MEQVTPFGVVELEGAGDGVEDRRRSAGDRAAFELGVVLDVTPPREGQPGTG
jgi:hypothetical protein